MISFTNVNTANANGGTTEPVKFDKRIKSSREEGFTYYPELEDMLNYAEIGLDDRIESVKEIVKTVPISIYSKSWKNLAAR